MPSSLFRFVIQHSLRDQFIVLAVTVLSFPLLYATLELPKIIINDALGAAAGDQVILGIVFDRTAFLGLLCLGFLLATLLWGLVKMRLNTLRGLLAERLLRRFRYALVERCMRFPLPYLRRISQGEIIAMTTAESEPLGGLMGDAIAQPVFQGGQVLTILGFLFIQSPWLGLASAALIPLQAWLIPRMQRRVNRLHRKRVAEMRGVAERIGETAGAIETLRANGGVRETLAEFSHRFGRLFKIRHEIFIAKYFMKFTNNLITQVTPFLFFSIGGYLVIQGSLTLGALVAALAAHRELSAPWRELLNFINQSQELGQRYRAIVERFAPEDLIDASLVTAPAGEAPSLLGPVRLDRVSLREGDGSPVLEDLSVEIPAGATVAVKSASAAERRALAQLLAGATAPTTGLVAIAGHDLSRLHRAALAARIGYAGPSPALLNRSIADNILMPLRAAPRVQGADGPDAAGDMVEAQRAGNSVDPWEADWLAPSLAGAENARSLRVWWAEIIEAMGTDDFLLRRALDDRMKEALHPNLAEKLVDLRGTIAEAMAERGLNRYFNAFDPERFNPGLAVGGNLLFAAPRKPLRVDVMAEDPRFVRSIKDLGLEADLLALGADILDRLMRVFGEVGVAHPMYRRLELPDTAFALLRSLDERRAARGVTGLKAADRALLMTLPFRFSVEQIGPAFPETLREKLVAERIARREELLAQAGDVFQPLAPDRWHDGLTILENLLFGRIAREAPERKVAAIRDTVANAVIAADLKRAVTLLIGDVEAGLGGANLPPVAHERIAFARAVVRRPDVLILDTALASHDAQARAETRRRLRELLPESTIVFLEAHFHRSSDYDMVIEIENGRLVGEAVPALEPATAQADLSAKLRVLEGVPPFAGADRAQIRLLAYGSDWIELNAGEFVFERGEASDAAFVLASGEAVFLHADGEPIVDTVATVTPGRVVGDLSVLHGRPRHRTLRAATRLRALRIPAQTINDVVENDAVIATSLLRRTARNNALLTERLDAALGRRGEEQA